MLGAGSPCLVRLSETVTSAARLSPAGPQLPACVIFPARKTFLSSALTPLLSRPSPPPQLSLTHTLARLHQTGVERLQTAYVRYHRAGEAHVAQTGWSLSTSRQNVDMLARSGLEPMVPDLDTPQAALFSTPGPEAATIRIVEAPAAFALPVKQDR